MVKTIRQKILLLLPTKAEEAIWKDMIALAIGITKTTVSQEVKRIRASGIPILWNRNGIYIDYDHDAIERQSKIINNMKIWYSRGMTNIQLIYRKIINWDYED